MTTVRLPSSISIVILFSLSGPVWSQLGATSDVSRNLPWDQGGSGGFGDAVCGDFDGDGFPDLATLRGDSLEVLRSVAALGLPVPSIPAVSAVTVQGQSSAADTLWLSDTAGIATVAFDPASESWSMTPLLGQPGGSENAVDLVIREGFSGQKSLVVVQSDQLSVQILALQPGTSLGPAEISSTRPIRRSCPVDLDGDGVDELALFHSDGVSVWTVAMTDGGEVWRLRYSSSFAVPGFQGVDMTTGRRSNGTEWIAWIAYDPNGVTQSVAYIEGGAPLTAISAGSDQISRIEAGDWNGDGNDDLVLSRQVDQRVEVALCQAGGWHDFTSPLTFPVSDSPDDAAFGNEARPVVADLNRDGDLDLALAVQSAEQVHLRFNESVDGDALAPAFFSAVTSEEDGELLTSPFMNLAPVSGEPMLHCQFEISAPETWPLIVNGNPVALSLEVDQYALEDAASAPHYVSTWASGATLTPSSPLPVTSLPTEEDVTFLTSTGYNVPRNEFYVFVVRYLQRQNNLVTFSTPPLVIGYHATGWSLYGEEGWVGPGAPATLQLVAWGGTGEPIDVFHQTTTSADDPATESPVTGASPPFTPVPTGSIEPVGGRVGVGLPLVGLPRN